LYFARNPDDFRAVKGICGLVTQFFAGDAAKTALYEKLRRFIMNAMEKNAQATTCCYRANLELPLLP